MVPRDAVEYVVAEHHLGEEGGLQARKLAQQVNNSAARLFRTLALM